MIDRLKTQENLEIKIKKIILFLYMIILLINYN